MTVTATNTHPRRDNLMIDRMGCPARDYRIRVKIKMLSVSAIDAVTERFCLWLWTYIYVRSSAETES